MAPASAPLEPRSSQPPPVDPPPRRESQTETVRELPDRPGRRASRPGDAEASDGLDSPRRLCATEPELDPITAPRRTLPPVGGHIDGKYRVLSLLGEGAMGSVLLAQDEHLDRRVAIKVVRPALLESEDFVRRLETEARVMARVHHPNVVQVHAFGITGGMPYLVMEYVPGTTLDRWLAPRVSPGHPLRVDLALGLLDPICRGVHAIHRAGTVHRDVKPGNVLVGPAFRLALTDFGLSHVLGRTLRPRGVFASGTPAYMAPELSTDPDPDPALAPRADVYSLGVMAFELLTGRLPFVASTVHAMVQAHAYADVPQASELRSELPRQLDDVLQQALAKSPEARTSSAEELRLGLLQARRACRAPRVRRAIVADDDPGYRALLTRTLARAFPGCVVESVPSGDMALAAIERDRVELAVIDLDMPGLNGIELAAAIRSHPWARHVPIIVATGVGSGADWELLERIGVEGIVTKPFDPEQLVSLARAVVEPSPPG